MKDFSRILVVCLLCYGCHFNAWAQPSLSFEIKKPKKFENKKLGSEKTGEKKFTTPRRFIQNTVTHYNWYFNANNRLNEVIDRAKAAHRDDYSQLLPFHNFSLEKTAADKSELDSVLYKTNAGILIHDLRNDWIDNLYMLMGKAYYFKNELDSAYLTFQYINYAFAPKEKDGYDKPIGSNASEGGSAFSISTKESDNIAKKIFSTPPSRNESFIWQIKTYLSKDEFPEAAGLIETLKNDPLFPERLDAELHEVQAWWYYKQEIFDSAAIHLEKALEVAENNQEVARWEYLIAQLYERANKPKLAQEFYARSIKHTVDPVLEVYARLNSIRQNKEDENAIQKSIDDLVKMARKDRYTNYRDIIYFAAAQIELERNNVAGAKALLLKATQVFNTGLNSNVDNNQKSKAFLLLGDLSFEEKNYADAKRFYDSVNVSEAGIRDPQAFDLRKSILTQIVDQSEIIYRQDSLQRLASMSEVEREAFIKKLIRKLRKAQGLKEEEGSLQTITTTTSNAPIDLFNTNVKGEWYFYNSALKSRGYTEFKNKWGNRSNVDNWRRMSAVAQFNATNQQTGRDGIVKPVSPAGPIDISYEGLLKSIPLTAPQLSASKDSIENATMQLGKLYLESLEDYPSAISTFEQFLIKFPYSSQVPEALFQLYYAYKKTGNTARASEVLKELQEKHAGTKYELLISGATTGNQVTAKADMTKRYEGIYNLFIEGNFDEALKQKKIADSLYSNNYWTPQLLYIQSIYHIRQRQDEEAKKVLQQIIQLYSSSPLSNKAKTMLDVLGRRKEIEDYLTKLEIQKPTDEIRSQPDTQRIVVNKPLQPNVKTEEKPPVHQPGNKKDTVQAKTTLPPPVAAAFTFNADAPHFVVVVMDKVDPVYVTESRNAFDRYNKQKYYNKVIDISTQSVDDSTKLVVMKTFENANTAIEYVEKTQKVTATEIIPWMPPGKYSFIIITEQNLEILKNSKGMNIYRKFLTQYFPGKF